MSELNCEKMDRLMELDRIKKCYSSAGHTERHFLNWMTHL